jgi:hypothetical protein
MNVSVTKVKKWRNGLMSKQGGDYVRLNYKPKFIQLVTEANLGWGNTSLVGLCDDGSVWYLYTKKNVDRGGYEVKWIRVPDIEPEVLDNNAESESQTSVKEELKKNIASKNGYAIKRD